jgi:rubrerythrin
VRCKAGWPCTWGTATAILLTFISSVPSAWPAITAQHLENAWRDELDAQAFALASAQRADAEGYRQVASLFRAVARGEAIHAANHSAALQKLAGIPSAQRDRRQPAPAVKSTRENIEAALQKEGQACAKTYPDLLRQARAEHNPEVVRTLNLARFADAHHARLYARALTTLDTLRGSPPKTLHICPGCGFVTERLPVLRCPFCDTPRAEFESGS